MDRSSGKRVKKPLYSCEAMGSGLSKRRESRKEREKKKEKQAVMALAEMVYSAGLGKIVPTHRTRCFTSL